MSVRVCAAAILIAMSLASCGGDGLPDVLGDRDCFEDSEDSGMTDGMDLSEPEWLPPEFPLPDDMQIRLIDAQMEEHRLMTGFVPDGEALEVITQFADDLDAAGWEIFVAPEAPLPESEEALVAFNEELQTVVGIDASMTELPVEVSEGDCSWVPGLLVGMLFDNVTAQEAEAMYPPVLRGEAHAVIGGTEFSAEGECLTQEGGSYFSALPGGDDIRLDVDQANGYVFASVNTMDGQIFNLDIDRISGVEPTSHVSTSGFSVEGMFVNGGEGERFLEGRVEAICE